MERTIRLAAVATLAIGLLAALPARANSEDTTRYVLSHAVDFADGMLTPDQIPRMHIAAYSSAVASACTGFVLDEDRFIEHFETLAHVERADMGEEQKLYAERHLLVTYGVAMGGFLAEAAAAGPQFCADAEKVRADADFANLWQ